MIEDAYFFDTYAILEIINGTESYKPYVNVGIVVTKLNLFELYYTLLKMHGKETALNYLHQFAQCAMDFNEGDIEVAAELKQSNKNLSMADCIGYAVAMRNQVKFLTGDMQFKDLWNVEFVK